MLANANNVNTMWCFPTPPRKGHSVPAITDFCWTCGAVGGHTNAFFLCMFVFCLYLVYAIINWNEGYDPIFIFNSTWSIYCVQNSAGYIWTRTCWYYARSIRCVVSRWRWLASRSNRSWPSLTESSSVVAVRSSCDCGWRHTELSTPTYGPTTPFTSLRGHLACHSVNERSGGATFW